VGDFLYDFFLLKYIKTIYKSITNRLFLNANGIENHIYIAALPVYKSLMGFRSPNFAITWVLVSFSGSYAPSPISGRDN